MCEINILWRSLCENKMDFVIYDALLAPSVCDVCIWRQLITAAHLLEQVWYRVGVILSSVLLSGHYSDTRESVMDKHETKGEQGEGLGQASWGRQGEESYKKRISWLRKIYIYIKKGGGIRIQMPVFVILYWVLWFSRQVPGVNAFREYSAQRRYGSSVILC